MEKHGQVASLCVLLVFDAVELLNETVKVFLMHLLNFAKAMAIGKRSLEKLFRILDMYDGLVFSQIWKLWLCMSLCALR